MPSGCRGVMETLMRLHHVQLLGLADGHGVHVVGIGRGHEQARRVGGRRLGTGSAGPPVRHTMSVGCAPMRTRASWLPLAVS